MLRGGTHGCANILMRPRIGFRVTEPKPFNSRKALAEEHRMAGACSDGAPAIRLQTSKAADDAWLVALLTARTLKSMPPATSC